MYTFLLLPGLIGTGILPILASHIISPKFLLRQPDHGAAVPKFGEWDETNPASADGFTHIFNKVREERQTGAGRVGTPEPSYPHSRKPAPDDSAKVCQSLILNFHGKKLLTLSFLLIPRFKFSRAAASPGAENSV